MDIRQSANAFANAISSGDAKRVAACFTPDGVQIEPGQPPLHGAVAIEQHFTAALGAFTAIAMSADEIYPAHDGAALCWTLTGTGRNGARLHVSGVDVLSLAPDGRIQKLTGYWDPSALAPIMAG